jgi:hypothetical protein
MWWICRAPRYWRKNLWFPWPLLMVFFWVALAKGAFPWWLFFVFPALFFWPLYALGQIFGQFQRGFEASAKRKNDEYTYPDHEEKPKRTGNVRYVQTSDGEIMEVYD